MKKGKGISIRIKIIIVTIIFMGVLTDIIVNIGVNLYYESVINSYIMYTDTVLEYAYRVADKYSFGDMIRERTMPDEYEEMRMELNNIKDSSKIEYLYAIYFDDIDDLNSLHYAINAKTQEELKSGKPLSEIYTYMGKPCEEGAFTKETLEILQTAVKSKKKDNGTIQDYSEGYGYMLNGYRVIFDKNNEAVGIVCVEINTNRISNSVKKFEKIFYIVDFALTGVAIILFLLIVRRYFVTPILKIAANSKAFVDKMKSNAEPEELIYEDVGFKIGGELALLSDNVKSLADGVSSYMTNLRTVTAERERINTELDLACKIQAHVLPRSFNIVEGEGKVDIYASMTPAKEVGGDFYDFFLIDDDHLGLVMADVSGKGIPAALFMMMSKYIIYNVAMRKHSPKRVLERTNDLICANNEDDMFVTVWFGILEISTGKVTAANAGHEYPIIRKPSGEYELLKDKHGFVVGIMEGVRYTEYEFVLEQGAELFVYTDGVPEATNADKKLFGTDRLIEAMNKSKSTDAKSLLENVKQAVDEFVGEAEQFDDLTMMGLKMK